MSESLQGLLESFWRLILAILDPRFLIPVAAILLIIIISDKKYKSGAYYKTTKESHASIRRDAGKWGEFLIYKYLRSYEDVGAKFLFNAYIPKQDGQTTEIDVLMISKKGIFVFESKDFSGWIFGSEDQKYWHQTLPTGRGSSNKEQFYNPIMQNRSHINHLKAFIGKQILMHSIIVFSDRCTFKNVQVKNENARVIYRNDLALVVSNIWNETSDMLNEEEVSELYNKLYPYTQVSSEVRKQHITDIRNKLEEQYTAPPIKIQHTEPEEAPVVEETLPKTSPDLPEEEQYTAPPIEIQRTEPEEAPVVEETLPKTSPDLPEAEDEMPQIAEPDKKEMPDFICPLCGGKLVLRTAKKGANAGNQFLGCSNFPNCRYISNSKQAIKDFQALKP